MKQFFHQASKEFEQEVTLIEVDGEKNKGDILQFSVVIAPTILVFQRWRGKRTISRYSHAF